MKNLIKKILDENTTTLNFDLEESYYGLNTKNLIKESDSLDWVHDVDPISFIKNAFKEGDMEYGMLVNGSYSVSVGIPEETEYTWDEEKMIEKELRERIGVFCYFGLARGSEDEHLMAIDVDTEKDLKKVLKWIKSSDKRIKENEDLGWVDSLAKEKPIKENQEFGSEDILLQGHKGYRGKVFVHRNLNKPPYWTIKARRGEDAGIVIGYDKAVHLNNVTFVVGEKSRQRVLASGQKNVHAGVVGDIVDGGMDTNGWIPVTYNPYTNRTFVRMDNGEPVFKAKEAILKNEKEVWVKL